MRLLGEDTRETTQALNAQLAGLLGSQPALHEVDPVVTRRLRAEGSETVPPPVRLRQGENRTVPGRHGPVRIRTFRRSAPDGVYLHLHGGGWVFGAADQQDPQLWELAEEANLSVVSVDYRLAPEHPYPAAPDDCEDVATWLLENARAELGSDRLVIGGESAGAHLSVLTLLRLRDRHGAADAFRAATLAYGAYDLSMTPSQRRWGTEYLLMSTPTLSWLYGSFLPGRSTEDRRDPAISPLYADLGGLPPALVSVGTQDPLLDDSLFLAARWQAAGGTVRLDVYADGLHGFTALPLPIAATANAAQAAFLADAARGPDGS